MGLPGSLKTVARIAGSAWFVATVLSAVAMTAGQEPAQPPAQTAKPQPTPEQIQERWNGVFASGAPALNRKPNSWLVVAVDGRRPGSALDLGIGQGRNALYLAERGWKVTGVDLSDVGVAQAKRTAAERNLQITAVVGDLETYDFGSEQWDLITSFYVHAWHDASKTDVPARILRALRPGGLVVMEAYAKPKVPFGFDVEALNQKFNRFRIIGNERIVAKADWAGGRDAPIVRFIAQKP